MDDSAYPSRNERGVEKIIRGRTWAMIRERCGESAADGDWEEPFEVWRSKQRELKSSDHNDV